MHKLVEKVKEEFFAILPPIIFFRSAAHTHVHSCVGGQGFAL